MPELKDVYTPSSMAKLGGRVTIFTAERADDEYHFRSYMGKVKIVSIPREKNEEWSACLKRILAAVEEARLAVPSQVFTGIHKENDWSKTFFWDKGYHICNRYGDYALVTIRG